MLRNNADVRRCSYFELGLPVLKINVIWLETGGFSGLNGNHAKELRNEHKRGHKELEKTGTNLQQ